MYSIFSSCALLRLYIVSVFIRFVFAATTPKALSVTPSITWYGDDGTWSAVSIRVGTPQQWVDVMVSTASSETWVVSPFGCDGSSACKSKRGGLFDFNTSTSWHNEGLFDLGLDGQLGFTGYGQYGEDVLEFGTTGVTLNNAVFGSINTTEYWLGFFGLGVIPGSFNGVSNLSPISGLVESEGSIPSHSYGFTAGAYYQQKSEPCSLTLGGFDANRFVPHNISFELNPGQQPEAFLHSVSVASSSSAANIGNWSSNPLQLLQPADGISVIIDSSTPFLWLPKPVCETFAHALGLTYNASLALYTFDGNASQHDALKSWGLEFTFGFTDVSTPSQVVNITLPYAAFDQQLSYPYIPNTTDATENKYYFPLRQAANQTQYTIGRAFLQEAYIITDYERNNFSIHQAVHTANPLGNTSIVDITRPSNTTFSTVGADKDQGGLGKTAVILISVGAVVVFLVLLALAFYLYWRRQRRLVNEDTIEPADIPTTPKEPGEVHEARDVYEADGIRVTPPSEIGVSTERYELPGPLPPVELECNGTPGVARQQSPAGRHSEWSVDSISENSSLDTIMNRSFRSSVRGFYSPLLSPQTPIVAYSSIPSPPPTYRPPTPRVDESPDTMRSPGQFHERNTGARRARVGKGRIGDLIEDSKR